MTQTPVASPQTREEIDTYLEFALQTIGEAENVYNLHGILARDFFKLAKSSQHVIRDLRIKALASKEHTTTLEDVVESLSFAGNKMLVANTDYIEALIEKLNEQKDTIDALRYKLRQSGISDD